MRISRLLIAVIACTSLTLGFGAGIAFEYIGKNTGCEKQYRLVNTDVVCGPKDIIQKTGYTETQGEVEEYILSQKDEGVAEVSVYFRDLVHGPTFGVNELANFAPASLLKLPLAFVFLISAEREPEVLTQKLLLEGVSRTTLQGVVPRVSAEVGGEYTIEELVRMMIVYSDNNSYDALESFIKNQPQRISLRHEIFQEIGLIDPKDHIEETITTRGYASLFRLLYNVSYLNAEASEKLLGWLQDGDYREALVAGVPEGTVVAHKFGERYLAQDKKQLHDCGIVYFPENPYLLCVMTRGDNFEKLEEVIAYISKIVYEEVDSRKL